MNTHILRRVRPLIPWLFCLWGLTSCIDRPREAVLITEVSPEVLKPGEPATIMGRGFGEPSERSNEQRVSIAGLPLSVDSWSDERLEVTLPPNLTGGERILTVSASGRPLASAPVFVSAPLAEGEPRETPLPQLDQGPTRDVGATQVDIGSDVDPPDSRPPPEVQIEYTPTQEGAAVSLYPTLVYTEGVLQLIVTVSLTPEQQQQTWGLASHLTFPTERLSFLGMSEQSTRLMRATTSEQLPGRVMFYRVNPTEDAVTLLFEVLDPEDSLIGSPPLTFSFVTRFSGIRDLQKQPMTTSWSGGSVRYVSP